MPRLNEIKERQEVVETIGGFAGSLQQIAAMRMTKLRQLVLDSKRFVEEATLILRELHIEKKKRQERLAKKGRLPKNDEPKKTYRTAIIAVTSDQGLCGSYNNEITAKIEDAMKEYPEADYFVIGKKGQSFMSITAPRRGVKYFPFNIPEAVSIKDLRPLIGMFNYYDQIFLIYNKYINTTTREVDFVELAIPNIEEIETRKEQEEGKFIFEPDLDLLIDSISARIRYALFRQQILDSKLALYTAQMIAMKTASDNAQELQGELNRQYNKARRKQIDKKILEVQAGRSLWDNEE